MCKLFAALIAAICVVSASAAAQENWPQRQVTIVVPFAPGGSADLIARILQQQMQARFGTPFVVENKSGAGGVSARAMPRRLLPTDTRCSSARRAPRRSILSSTNDCRSTWNAISRRSLCLSVSRTFFS